MNSHVGWFPFCSYSNEASGFIGLLVTLFCNSISVSFFLLQNSMHNAKVFDTEKDIDLWLIRLVTLVSSFQFAASKGH